MNGKEIARMGLVLAAVLWLWAQAGVCRAGGDGLIRIVGELPRGTGEQAPSVRIVPETLEISRGQVVTWYNWARSADCVNVIVEARCEELANVEREFNRYGPCYFTGWMPFGTISRLKFNGEGVFEYKVEVRRGQAVTTHTGRIVVR